MLVESLDLGPLDSSLGTVDLGCWILDGGVDLGPRTGNSVGSLGGCLADIYDCAVLYLQ